MITAPPLFIIEADRLLSGDDGADVLADEMGGPIANDLVQKHRRWLAGVDHAPPWRVPRGGLGFEIAPIDTPKGMAAHFLPLGDLAGRALSLTLDAHTRAHADVPPVLRGVAEFALSLATELDSAWVAWTPAHMAYPRAFLAEQMAGWTDDQGGRGGLIPLLAFVHFGEDAGGATVTRGMAFFRLPELRFTSDAPMAKGDQVRRMIRMAYALLADTDKRGPQGWDGDYDGLSPGETMRVRRRGDILNLASSTAKSARG